MTQRLFDRARAIQQRAYAPYSRFRVGAAIQTGDGRIYVGCNVENASFGLTLCAERAAVAAAVADGATELTDIAIATDIEPPAAPCGACRQVLREFGPAMRVHAVGPRSVRSWTLPELLPDSFGAEALA